MPDNHSETHLYTMSISLNVLNHLGIGLYSNIPAVLSEVVANSWDADADQVKILIDRASDRITIDDDGHGMTRQDINKKYLNVGYQRRLEGVVTEKGRHVMGRKGIGKLSVFSIARVVEVYSVKNGERSGLVMDREEIKKCIESEGSGTYHPTPLDTGALDLDRGTRLILRGLDKSLTTTAAFLRKRLARRFSIIGDRGGFTVIVDGKTISPQDRDFYGNLEFLWYFGAQGSEVLKECGDTIQAFKLNGGIEAVDDDGTKHSFEAWGWLGTVDRPESLEEVNNSIAVFAHGKVIQEDVLKDFKEAGVYADYVIGEVNADFLDLDDRPDIVTSDRQRVKEDDWRYRALKDFIKDILTRIKKDWTLLRQQRGTVRALENPVIREWYARLKGDNRKYAERLFGKIESLKIKDAESKKELYKASLLAFERLALRQALSAIDTLESERDFELLQRFFDGIDELEATHYHEIVKGRLRVLRKFVDILPDAKERVLQSHIFDHLWLLDPSWERAAYDPRVEESVTKEFRALESKLKDEERKGRIDIRYRTAAGKHIIIELKKYDRKVTIEELIGQLRKYRSALKKCLREKFPGDTQPIEVISILGSPPEPRDEPEQNEEMLRPLNARYITYDVLIRQTLSSYSEYLEKDREVSALIAIIDKLDVVLA